MAIKQMINYEPTKLQGHFHESNADEILFGGAAGGGKSMAIIADAMKKCLKHKNIAAYVFRRTYKESEDILVPTAHLLIPKETGKYSAKDHNIEFNNGSSLRFRHCFKSNDMYKYQGAEINFLYIDELTHFTKEIYDYLKTRLRANINLHIEPKIRCTSNPGGIGHAWVKKRFIDLTEPFSFREEKVYSATLKKTKAHTIQYIPARVTDNPHISQDYIFELEKKPESMRKALLTGDWNTFAGQAFPEWADDINGYSTAQFSHVIKPFEIPNDWKLFRSFDFGYSKPFSVLWWALDFEDTIYLIHEWYGASDVDVGLRLTLSEVAEEIKKREIELFSGRSITGPADPSIWDKSRGISVADQLEKSGVYFYPGDNSRLAGKMQFHYRLDFDENGYAKFYVFNTCKEFIRTFPSLVIDKFKVEDVDTKCEDHSYDAARYFLMSVPSKLKIKPKRRKTFNPLADKNVKLKSEFLTL